MAHIEQPVATIVSHSTGPTSAAVTLPFPCKTQAVSKSLMSRRPAPSLCSRFTEVGRDAVSVRPATCTCEKVLYAALQVTTSKQQM